MKKFITIAPCAFIASASSIVQEENAETFQATSQEVPSWDEERQHLDEDTQALKKQLGWTTLPPELDWDDEMKKKNEELQEYGRTTKDAWYQKMNDEAEEWLAELLKKKPEFIKQYGEEEGEKKWDEEHDKEQLKQEKIYKDRDAEWQVNFELDILHKGLEWQKQLAETQKFETMTKREQDWIRESFEETKNWELFRMDKELKFLGETKQKYAEKKAKEDEEKKKIKAEQEEKRKKNQITDDCHLDENNKCVKPSEFQDVEKDLEKLTHQMNLEKAELDAERLKAQLELDETVIKKESEWKDYLLNLAKAGEKIIPAAHVQERIKTRNAWDQELQELNKAWTEGMEKGRQEYAEVIEANERAEQEAYRQEMLRLQEESTQGDRLDEESKSNEL